MKAPPPTGLQIAEVRVIFITHVDTRMLLFLIVSLKDMPYSLSAQFYPETCLLRMLHRRHFCHTSLVGIHL